MKNKLIKLGKYVLQALGNIGIANGLIIMVSSSIQLEVIIGVVIFVSGIVLLFISIDLMWIEKTEREIRLQYKLDLANINLEKTKVELTNYSTLVDDIVTLSTKTMRKQRKQINERTS